MSWNIRYESKQDFENDTRAPGSTDFGDSGEHVTEQVDAARDAATALIESGVAGNDEKDFTVSLNGHANPHHEPSPQYANDAVTISVSQKSPATK